MADAADKPRPSSKMTIDSVQTVSTPLTITEALHVFYGSMFVRAINRNILSGTQSDADDLSKVRDIEELHKAAKSGDCDVIKSCDFKALNIDGVNSKGLTALHLACREGNFDVVAELLQRGANIETTTKWIKQEALCCSSQLELDFANVLRYSLSASPSRKRNSPLHVAALGGKLEVVKKLLEHGADVNKLAENGMTPLYMAAQENHIDVAKELLAHGADAHLAASGGFEPVDVAIQQRHSEMTAFLMEQGSKSYCLSELSKIVVKVKSFNL
eukprot:gene8673-14693_t